MHGKRASLIVNLRSGRTVLKVPEIVAALYAAGWKTDVYLKEYSGETLQLAEQAEMVENLHEGEKITVEGKKSKRGVIDADCVMLS